MPHSTTKKFRPKRPDSRPNGQRRNKERLKVVDKLEAKDIISTRIPKSQQKERPVSGELRKPRKPSDKLRVRSLYKLLRQIKVLDEKQSAGEVLNAAQRKKLGRMDDVIAELEELLEVDEGDSDGHDSEEIGGEVEHMDSSEAGGDEKGEDERVEDETNVNAKRTIQSKNNRKKKKSKTGNR